MCQQCGCGVVGEVSIGGRPGSALSSPMGEPHRPGESREAPTEEMAHGHHHGGAGETDAHAQGPSTKTIEIERNLLEKNDRLAERNRGYFRAKGLLVLNVLSSPGSGKTTFIQKTAEALEGKLRPGVVVGDLATENDADRLREAGMPVVQITTGNVCHLEADMVAKAVGQLDLDALDILIIENVGNLVCPSAYDLGEDLRVVLLSVTEGEDKPLKYPPMFHTANVAVITKVDMAEAAGFERTVVLRNLERISHHARVFELSARTGEGMAEWIEYLAARCQAVGSAR